MTAVRRLSGWKNATLMRLAKPLRWTEQVGSRTTRRQASFVIESNCLGTMYYPANRFAQVIGEPVLLARAA